MFLGRLFRVLAVVFAIGQYVNAAMEIESPAMGDTFTVSGSTVTIPVTWEDDGESPSLDEIKSYTFVLMTGPNNAIHPLQTIKAMSASSISGTSYDAVFDADVGADGLYYVQVYCLLNTGGYTIRYTNRVTLSGMTGTYEASGSGNPPDNQQSDTTSSVDVSKSILVTYTLQTGKTRYAPMQMQPGTEITATTWSRRFPSSAVTYYSTFGGTPVCLSTVTPGWSYTMSSLTNYATPAPFPSEVGWYAASARLATVSLDANVGNLKNSNKLKKRRWVD